MVEIVNLTQRRDVLCKGLCLLVVNEQVSSQSAKIQESGDKVMQTSLNHYSQNNEIHKDIPYLAVKK